MNNDSFAIVVDDLSVAYATDGKKSVACSNISFKVRPGEFVAIVGSSGCGKTTLLNAIAGFLKPMTGAVYAAGTVVEQPTAQVTMVFQSYALFPWMTIEQNMRFGLQMKGIDQRRASELITRYLEMIGLSGTEALYPYQLSGGMQQRVALARALVIEPAIVLLDEPFAAVDLQTRETLQDELAALVKANMAQTMVLVTHSVDEAVYLSDRVLVMGKCPGQIIASYDIDFGKRRSREIRSSPEYLAIRDAISTDLRNLSNGSRRHHVP